MQRTFKNGLKCNFKTATMNERDTLQYINGVAFVVGTHRNMIYTLFTKKNVIMRETKFTPKQKKQKKQYFCHPTDRINHGDTNNKEFRWKKNNTTMADDWRLDSWHQFV